MQSFSPDFIVGWLKKLTDSDAQQKIHEEPDLAQIFFQGADAGISSLLAV